MVSMPASLTSTVVAAFLTALVSLLGLIISKEQKVSEFRQAWIDALRSDIAAVIANAMTVEFLISTGESQRSDFFEKYRSTFLEFSTALARIRLRINGEEEVGKKVLDGLYTIAQELTAKRGPDSNRLRDLRATLVTDSQELLKNEWRRVRDGEGAFKVTKAAFLLIILIMGALIVYRIASFAETSTAPVPKGQPSAGATHASSQPAHGSSGVLRRIPLQ